MHEPPLIVRCPTCKKTMEYRTDNPSRPFCSAHCRLMDTAAWAEGSYKISRSLNQDDEQWLGEQLAQPLPPPFSS